MFVAAAGRSNRKNLQESSGIASLVSLFSACAFLALTAPAFGQSSTPPSFYVDDWTFHHLIFTNPSNLPPDQRSKTTSDFRYQMQQAQRNTQRQMATVPLDGVSTAAPNSSNVNTAINSSKNKKGTLKKDWNTNLNGTAASGYGAIAGLTSSNVSGSSTLTVDSVVLSASAPTAASLTGTFTGCSSSCGAITIGSLVMTASATASTASGSAVVNAQPNTNTMVITNGSNSDTLTIKSAGTTGSVTGTFSGGGTGSITIGNVVFSPGSTLSTRTVTFSTSFSSATSNGDTVTIAGGAYRLESSPSQASDVLRDGSNNSSTVAGINAANLAAAINNDPTLCGSTATINNVTGQCFWPTGATANTSVAASVSGAVVTLANRTTSSVTLAKSSSNSSAITVSGSSIAGSSATTCGTTTGVFLAFANATAEANAFATLVNSCAGSTAGVSVTNSAGVITITTSVPGSVNYSESNSEFLWTGSGTSIGTNGTASCTSMSNPYAASFAASPLSLTTLATNIEAAINLCLTTTTEEGNMDLVSGQTSSGTTVNLKAYTAGTSGDGVTFTGSFLTPSSGSLSGGGSGTCTSSTAGTFAPNGTAATMASYFVGALNDSSCASALAAAGITTGSASGTGITITASTSGTGGNSITVSETSSGFSWTGAATKLANGADGSNSSTTFAYWSVNTYVTNSVLATNIANAVNSNATLQANTGEVAVANLPSSGDVTFTARQAGAANNFTVVPASFTAFNSGSTLTISNGASPTALARVQPNAYPAKFGASLTSADCSDFVVYPTGAAGATSVANIIAYDNLYDGGCATGAIPSVNWAYSTGTGYAVTTSPIISYDATGSQIAYVQSNGTDAQLVILQWASSTGTPSVSSPDSATLETSVSTFRAGCAPCYYTVNLVSASTNRNDTYSSPYYDYHDDAIYVGDDAGYLHKITGVFNGATTIGEASGWPVLLKSGDKISSPVYDYGSTNVFVGDFSGYFYSVPSAGGTAQTSAQLADAFADAPLVVAGGAYGDVFAFATTSTATSHVTSGSNTVFEFSTSFTTNSGTYSTGWDGYVQVGTGGSGFYFYAGTFDNVFYSSSNNTGNLYVVGNTGVTTGAILYRIPISTGSMTGSANALGTGTLTSSATDAYPWASPLTEFCNPGTASACVASSTATTTGTDYLFVSVNRGAATIGSTSTGCTASSGYGCVLSFNISNEAVAPTLGASSALSVTTPGTDGCWATGGMAIDNSDSTNGGSQIYLVELNGADAGSPFTVTGSCTSVTTDNIIDAVQAGQSAP